MPESAEARILCEQVAPFVLDRTLRSVVADTRRNYAWLNDEKDFIGQKVTKVYSHGKRVVWQLENLYSLAFSFGMTGTFQLTRGPHTRVDFRFQDLDGSIGAVFFEDIRCFGKVFYTKPASIHEGIDPYGVNLGNLTWSQQTFDGKLNQFGNFRIAEAILDQGMVAGIGNYLRAEILYRAKINPWKKVKDLQPHERQALFVLIPHVLQEAYEAGGATLSTFKNVLGLPGTYADKLRVYKKDTDPFGAKVEKTLDKSKRAMWWVPAVQI